MRTIRSIRDRVILGMVAVGLCGADCRERGTTGSSGEYEFRLSDPTLLGERALIPLAPGGTEVTVLAEARGSGCGGAPAFREVRSTDPDVASVTLADDRSIALVTGAAGTTELQLVDDGGVVVDSVEIEVVSIASLELASADDPAQIAVGTTGEIEVILVDSAGRRLGAGSGRITPATTGGFTATSTDTFTGAVFEVTAAAPGAGTVSATAGTVTSSLALTAALPAEVTSIAIGTGGYAPTYNPNNQVEVVYSMPATAQGPVHGTPCTWEISDPSVELVANGAETDLGEPARNFSQFRLDRAGSFDVTCTIGSAELTVTLRR